MSENERRLTNVQITEEMYGGKYVRPNSCPYCTRLAWVVESTDNNTGEKSYRLQCDSWHACISSERFPTIREATLSWNRITDITRKNGIEKEQEKEKEEKEMNGMMKAEISDCPYCKNRADVKAEHIDGLHSSWVYIACTRCGARGPQYICDDTDTARYIIMATKMWNMIARDDE